MNKNIIFLYKEITKNNKKKEIKSIFKNFISFYLNKKYKEDELFLENIDITNDYKKIKNDYKKINFEEINLKEIKNESKIVLLNGKYIFSENINKNITIEEKENKINISYENFELLKNNLNFFYILNKTFSKKKTIIKINENFVSEKRIYILNISKNTEDDEKFNVFSEIELELKKNSAIEINQINANISKNIFSNLNLILNIKENSKLTYNLETFSSFESINSNSIFSFQEKKSMLRFEDIFTDKQKVKNFYNFFLKDKESEFKNKSLRKLEKNSYYENICKIFHLESYSKSDINFYAAGLDESRCAFKNNIFVEIDINLIEAKVKSDALALSEKSEFILVPELDINSSNIKCSHGATVGSMNEKILFYMMSRGLSKKECIEIITESFLFKNFNKEKLFFEKNKQYF